jgi:hypothetical protein
LVVIAIIQQLKEDYETCARTLCSSTGTKRITAEQVSLCEILILGNIHIIGIAIDRRGIDFEHDICPENRELYPNPFI